MTVYDDYPSGDGRGGPHPLAGIPQEVLDAATDELASDLDFELDGKATTQYFDYETIEAIAHSVLASAINASEHVRLERRGGG